MYSISQVKYKIFQFKKRDALFEYFYKLITVNSLHTNKIFLSKIKLEYV